MDTRPIGVFDSGLGGLTAVRVLRRIHMYKTDLKTVVNVLSSLSAVVLNLPDAVTL